MMMRSPTGRRMIDAGVRHVPDGDALTARDDDVVDRQDGLRVHPDPGHLLVRRSPEKEIESIKSRDRSRRVSIFWPKFISVRPSFSKYLYIETVIQSICVNVKREPIGWPKWTTSKGSCIVGPSWPHLNVPGDLTVYIYWEEIGLNKPSVDWLINYLYVQYVMAGRIFPDGIQSKRESQLTLKLPKL